LSDPIGSLRLDPLVNMRAVIAVRPPVEAAVLHRRHVVGDEVAAQLVAFVDRGPERAALRLPGKADRVTKPRGEDPRAPGGGIDFQDGGAADFVFEPLFTRVAVRADR